MVKQIIKICEKPGLGRHVVANLDLTEGQIVLIEQPLIRGPAQITSPVCLGCLKSLNINTATECSKCGWPMCEDLKCLEDEWHRAECDWTANQRKLKVKIKNFDIPHPSYQSIIVIRCLYQKQNNPEIWTKLISLESHCANRRGGPKYEADKIWIADYLYRFFKLNPEEYPIDEILKVCGIVQVNGHEVPLTDPAYVAIYDIGSMLEHSCIPNCSKTFTSDGHLLIRTAGTAIKYKQNLSICYTDPLWGTPQRLAHLADTKYFVCKCSRCSDPTELGTYYSGVKCTFEDCMGYALPNVTLSSTDPFNVTWICNFCTTTADPEQVERCLAHIGKDMAAMNRRDPEHCRKFLDHYVSAGDLHPNHYYFIDIRLNLAQLYGQIEGQPLDKLSQEQLVNKRELCLKILKIADILFPAENRLRGSLMFEMHSVMAEEARRSNHDTNSLIEALLRSKYYLEQAENMLKHEPKEMPEGQMANQCKKNAMDLETLLKKLHDSAQLYQFD
ncbi:SET domain-containing protein SmydA-8-like isoform X4 [Daktulosphaira vitifoliae]|uniref:SET domain-containing protein SmydA-8-like isoform X4 n=1 Tax=Daktulosphaira vitifoliae TaxID=58002 RepID=UPI0021AA29F1|nr:SET domain-containing protein SmydA-8-like isoform X4 [Daktulosphaira vitifoliae]